MSQITKESLPEMKPIKEIVCYSPELDNICLLTEGSAFLFNDNEGLLVLLYRISGPTPFLPHKYYLIGEL